MSSKKPGSSEHPTDADAARVVDGDSHYEGSDMDRAATDAERSHGHHPKDREKTDRRLPPTPIKKP